MENQKTYLITGYTVMTRLYRQIMINAFSLAEAKHKAEKYLDEVTKIEEW